MKSCKPFSLASLVAGLCTYLFTATAIAAPMPDTFADLVKNERPAVVNISTTQKMEGVGPHSFKDFFGKEAPREHKVSSLGSGFIISKDGYIITNYHVIEKSTDIKVKLSDEREFEAKVVGKDKKLDLALLKIEAKENLPFAPMGDSDVLREGDWVIAIGNPFGLGHTVTAGIVSAKGRVIGAGPYDDFIQTDAAINPGNSGGPLFNIKGEVIGINTAIISQSGGSMGIGFAIPINMAKEILDSLKAKGVVVRGWLGVYVQKITPQLAESFKLKDQSGALVADVVKDGPADKGGLKQGDVIVEFDGRKIKDMSDLPKIVANTPVGKTVKVVVLRNGETTPLSITIQKLAEEGEVEEGSDLEKFGLTLQNLTPEIAKQLKLTEETGVLVTGVLP
ncbi:MAG: DegQ family serine endoprotease, partial [Nitrospirota bacterium]|nr:DegQ family serine endoprotease [Nitrospirota bacterium]